MKPQQKFIHGLMAIVLVVSLVAPAALMAVPSPSAAMARLQPLLVEMAEADPDQPVRVIVQRADPGDRAEHTVVELGGLVIRELDLLDAFVAELSANATLRLAAETSVNWIALDTPVVSSGRPTNDPCATDCPPNFYLDTLNVEPIWELGYDGEGIGVVVIDSGIFKDRDFTVTPGKPHSRVNVQISFNSDNVSDSYGHGTHVAGIIGGNGEASGGFYSGVAPKVDFINLKISDDFGMAYESDTVDALQWVLDNKDTYNIRVVNLSINSTVEMSYHDSPMNAAAEILWFNGIVVVASAGNKGAEAGYNTVSAAPANDPYFITVGASHEHGTSDRTDDTVAPFSGFGITLDGFAKPEIVAPGKDIISVLSPSSDWYNEHPDRAVLDNEYFRISGTSMAAPMVTGAVALLLQAEPDLTPDQVKYRLINTAGSVTNNHGVLYPYLNVYAALTTPTTESANPGVIPHMLLAKMAMIAYWSSQNGEENIDWENVDWAAVNWDAVNWNAVNWNAVNWNAVNWNAVNWNAVNWNAVNWNAVNWNAVNWNAVNWNSVNWNAVNWNSVNWNSVSFAD